MSTENFSLEIRRARFSSLFPKEPSFRYRQMERALFEKGISGWEQVTTLPKSFRTMLSERIPWMSLRESIVLESRKKDTKKAILECEDGSKIETVLMQNARGHWSICVSSQVGCAMGCTFCATGKMGFTRNLSTDEIVDQFRFWRSHLDTNLSSGEVGESRNSLISNVVFMGMGEPLANYDAVRDSIVLLLRSTSLGPTRITVSTVGLLPALRKLLADPLWPSVRLAISLHSADAESRKRLMPSSFDSFLDDLVTWTRLYFERNEERRRHLTFEYILLRGVNDREEDARKLLLFSRRVGKVRVNLIPYNSTANDYREMDEKEALRFLLTLKRGGVMATIRKAMGKDIAAACGQLVTRVLSRDRD
ncbi:MAG: 23S rRNA (adenine(2503)-C(2))-methyltransferase RlmN [Candidatus Moraniibacteriota bacterium]|nr:MAG: 23S rRNA (adenine(2503)-C(2))-methyltransferase RlmN [Candidatus Moranbacteria bacterium]